MEEARKINRLIRKYVKRILHLPTWTSNNWFHHRNGGNIPDLEKRTMITRLKATTKMKLSTDEAARTIGDQLNPHNEQQVQRMRLPNSINIKEAVYQQMEDRLKRMNNRKSLVTMLQSHHKRQWIRTKRGLTPGNKLRYIQALSGSLPTKVNKTRGIQERQTKICRRCKLREIEDDMNILAKCTFNKDLITNSHDHLVRKIAKELKKAHPNGNNWCERSGTELMRPGFKMVNGDRVSIIEVTLPYETSEEYLEKQRSEKKTKYKQLVEEELHHAQCTEGEVIPIVTGELGTMTKNTIADLKRLNLTKQKDALQMTTATGSVNIINNHLRRHDFD